MDYLWHDYVLLYAFIGYWLGLFLGAGHIAGHIACIVLWPIVLIKLAIRGLKEV